MNHDRSNSPCVSLHGVSSLRHSRLRTLNMQSIATLPMTEPGQVLYHGAVVGVSHGLFI